VSEQKPRILTILGSTREGRFGDRVFSWFEGLVSQRSDLIAEFADLRDFDLPFFNQPKSASSFSDDEKPQPWSETIGRNDGFVIISPEYNHAPPAVLKNALDWVYAEWKRKPVGFVGYGGVSGGARAIEQLRAITVELGLAPLTGGVVMQFARKQFDEHGQLRDPDFFNSSANAMLDELVWWATTLKAGREAAATVPA